MDNRNTFKDITTMKEFWMVSKYDGNSDPVYFQFMQISNFSKTKKQRERINFNILLIF